jgi:hypothetical protein
MIGPSDASKVTILNSGSVGVGTTSAATKLQVLGDIRVGTTGTNGCLQNFAGTALTGTCSSDERLKTDITQISNTLEKIGMIQAVTYKWNGSVQAVNDRKYDTTVTNRGVLAQNIETQFPELVVTDSDGYKQVDYTGLSIYTLAAVAELASSTLHSGNSGFDMRGQALTNVKSIASASGNWSIDENGLITVKEIKTDKLCVGTRCVTQAEFESIFGAGTTATPPAAPPTTSTTTDTNTGTTTGTTTEGNTGTTTQVTPEEPPVVPDAPTAPPEVVVEQG